MIEIERKFLVISDVYKLKAQKSTRIIQGYLNSDPIRTVRVRVKGEKGFITIKGEGSASGTSRYEWEKEIDVTEAEELLMLCEKGKIEKTRFEIPFGNHIFEVDEFYGENQGLVVAEIELKTENEVFLKPDWLGVEVTGNNKYYNSQLSKVPYSRW